jgi:hypothetical protein
MRPGSGLQADIALNRDCIIRSFVIFEILPSIISSISVFLAYLLYKDSITAK